MIRFRWYSFRCPQTTGAIDPTAMFTRNSGRARAKPVRNSRNDPASSSMNSTKLGIENTATIDSTGDRMKNMSESGVPRQNRIANRIAGNDSEVPRSGSTSTRAIGAAVTAIGTA